VDVSWITFTSASNGQGSGGVDFQVAANSGLTPRQGSISVNGQRVLVEQAEPQRSCGFSLDPNSQSLPADGGSGQFTVMTDIACSWTAASTASWITLTRNASGKGSAAVGFDVTANPGGARTGTIQVAGEKFTVTQASRTQPGGCTFSVSPLTVAFPSAASQGSVAISSGSGCSWTASTSAAWMTITSPASGSGNGTVAFDTTANSGPQRTGTLTIADQTVTVTQAAAVTCGFTLAPVSNTSVNEGGGSFAVIVTASIQTCAWSASVVSGSWIRITSAPNGTGNGTVTYVVDPNTGPGRSGTMNIAGQDFTVTQAATSCTFSIAPGSQSFTKAGGAGGPIVVTTAPGCAWTATSNDPWITNVSPSSKTGSGSVTFTVESKPGNNLRNGTITIAGQTFKVDQR
jgi:hypothetical protein